MHRPATRVCSFRRLGFALGCNLRFLSNAGAVPLHNSDKQTLESLVAWQDSCAQWPSRMPEDTKDVVLYDLSATLEAHRATNRAAVIRKCAQETIRFVSTSHGEELTSVAGDTGQRRFVSDGASPQDAGTKKSTDPLEYAGAAQSPKRHWKYIKTRTRMQLQRPWLPYMEHTQGDYAGRCVFLCLQAEWSLPNSSCRLSNEIRAYEAYLRLTAAEEAACRLVAADVYDVVRDRPDVSNLTLVGSRSTGLATPSSDFDFSLPLPSGSRYRQEAWDSLGKVHQHLKHSNCFVNTKIVHAMVPLVSTRHIATGLHIQIQAPRSDWTSQEYIAAYLTEHPSLRPLYIVIRHFLEIRGLTTVFKGGLGSYSIFMMVVTAIKHSSGNFAADDLASQLMHFLDFYGNADLYKYGFSANPPQVFEKHGGTLSLKDSGARSSDSQLSGIDMISKYDPRQPYLLCLQDPADDQNDLGKKAYAIKHIQATFQRALECLKRAAVLFNKRDNGTRSCLDSLVRANYIDLEQHRSRIERYSDPKKREEEVKYSEDRVRRDFQDRLDRYKASQPRNGTRLHPETVAVPIRMVASGAGLPMRKTRHFLWPAERVVNIVMPGGPNVG